MALYRRKPHDVIHHSDQGCQYTSIAFGSRCREAGVRPSIGSVGDAYDNAMCESFNATLECELLVQHSLKRIEKVAQQSSTSSKAGTIRIGGIQPSASESILFDLRLSGGWRTDNDAHWIQFRVRRRNQPIVIGRLESRITGSSRRPFRILF
jgi:transposase InsO family protein